MLATVLLTKTRFSFIGFFLFAHISLGCYIHNSDRREREASIERSFAERFEGKVKQQVES